MYKFAQETSRLCDLDQIESPGTEMSRRLAGTAFAGLLMLTAAAVHRPAHAWFIFIPGSVSSKIGDILTGAEGDSCVSERAKAGDVLNSPSGSTAVIKSLSGTSSRCQQPGLPIRALLHFNLVEPPNVKIDLPNDFEQQPLTDMQKYQGLFLKASYPMTKSTLHVSHRKKDGKIDGESIARNVSNSISRATLEPRILGEEKLRINGLPAWRFEMEAKNNAVFKPQFTYLITVLEDEKDFIVVNVSTSSDNYSSMRDTMKQVATSLIGLTPPTTTAATAAPKDDAQLGLPPAEPAQSLISADAPSPGASGDHPAGDPARTIPAPSEPAQTLVRQEPAGEPSGSQPAPQTPTSQPPPPAPLAQPAVSTASSSANRLRELHKLQQEGVITAAEFEEKKRMILKDM